MQQCTVSGYGEPAEDRRKSSDVWSVGILVQNLVLGSATRKEREEVRIMHCVDVIQQKHARMWLHVFILV